MLAIIVLAVASHGISSMAEYWDEEPAERRNLAIDFELQGVLKQEQAYSSCPEGYPAYGTLGDLLKAWNPNDPDVPEDVVVERLRVSPVDCSYHNWCIRFRQTAQGTSYTAAVLEGPGATTPLQHPWYKHCCVMARRVLRTVPDPASSYF